ncbi:MAG: multiheme c-type cytochrome ExtKL [Desulfobulbaceae bacterium]|nr:multiheme c-type cytochrome ExtKL [Desulfobulbaceae bacterium]
MRIYPTMKIFAILAVAMFALVQTSMAKEADTIDELVAMFDDSKCAECHEQVYKEWQNSWHSKAIVSSLKGMRNFIAVGLAKEWNTPVTKAEVLKCLDCHAPAVNYASEKLAKELAGLIVTSFDKKDTDEGKKAKAQLARLNVGCYSCHHIKATEVAKGLRGEPKKGVIYTGSDVDAGDAHESIQTVDITRSVFCMQCHGVYKAPDGETIKCNTLSGSYQNTYQNHGGSQTCQECHMKKGHLFPGGHDIETVTEGLGFNVEIAQYQHLPGKIAGVKDKKKWVPSAVVNAFIENKTGHRVPDG